MSLPCWELFDARTRRTATRSCRRPSGSGSASRSACPLGWERWVGDEGAIIGLDHFGASAPAGTIFEKLGFTAERVADVARRVVRDGLRGRIPTLDPGISRPGSRLRSTAWPGDHGGHATLGSDPGRPCAAFRPASIAASDQRAHAERRADGRLCASVRPRITTGAALKATSYPPTFAAARA